MARPRHRSGNLPAETTSFVGRRRELAEIRKKLASARLVSLVGPGGVGKTRLALRAATDLERGFRDGAWLVELAEVRDAAIVLNAVLAAVDLRDQAGVEPLQILRSFLGERHLLLVLDNCEHVLEAAAQLISEALRSAPNLRVIATSREPLQVTGEHVVPVTPLQLPRGDGTEALGQVRENEAVVLFTERAAAASGTFVLTASNQAAVVAVCRRLDGLPLAIELAAVRTRVLSVEQILERLRDRFALLTGGSRAALPRHQTLRLTIDWSYDILTSRERQVLRRLSVFAARFTLSDVESVCTDDELSAIDTLDLLSSLVDKSLLMKEDFAGRDCYRLHETMREYATLKLHDECEDENLSERCINYYWSACLSTEAEGRYELPRWLSWVELEIDNIRAVLEQCVSHGDAPRGLDIVASLRYFWITHGTTESIRWLDLLLALGQASPRTQVRALSLRGWMSILQGDPEAARPWLTRAIATARETRQPAELSQVLSIAANAENQIGNPIGANAFLDEAEAIAAGMSDYAATIELVQARAVHAFFANDMDAATVISSEGMRLSQDTGDLFYLASMLRNVAVIALTHGDLDAANVGAGEALRIARQIDDRIAEFYILAAMSWLAASAGHARLGARLLGAAQAIGAGAGAKIVGPHAPFQTEAREAATRALGATKFEAEFEAGKRLDRHAAVRLALGESEQTEDVARFGIDAGPLAKREFEVAGLVAEGLSNKQIAARLFISERTVATHVGHILNKLGFNSRAQIAGWISSNL
ncbi:MAG: LuxR C-terminal-related transcriptional regulator [Candidatus Dormibacteria bacterium]|jgi:predicted ATPase/DNA-binding CsgD family transcriptional regulator